VRTTYWFPLGLEGDDLPEYAQLGLQDPASQQSGTILKRFRYLDRRHMKDKTRTEGTSDESSQDATYSSFWLSFGARHFSAVRLADERSTGSGSRYVENRGKPVFLHAFALIKVDLSPV